MLIKQHITQKIVIKTDGCSAGHTRISYRISNYNLRIRREKLNRYMTGFKKYTVFTDRPQRSKYWYFLLLNFLISSGLGIIDAVIGLFDPQTELELLSVYNANPRVLPLVLENFTILIVVFGGCF